MSKTARRSNSWAICATSEMLLVLDGLQSLVNGGG